MLRILTGILWALLLFVFTCAISFHRLVYDFELFFVLQPNPDWMDFFKLQDFDVSDSEWILRKLGHMAGFFILALLLGNLGRNRWGVYAAILYALATEVMQLFFYRGGRLYDVLIDTAGILLAIWLSRRWSGRVTARS
ncbi:VanZ family protein [Paenibacillus sp. IB182496]|uniref:VanZ family protein n=1 Tax=Paenibacillus sabuli TaxID=2772509 RepID=A0A927BX94_9BACL|nr:VanZ family protein [Paenibacillus sabuli]MBD2848562.1 VanZ family protein [Paenibacillus sabuli]